MHIWSRGVAGRYSFCDTGTCIPINVYSIAGQVSVCLFAAGQGPEALAYTLTVDMQGVSKSPLNLRVGNKSLIIEGVASIKMTEGTKAQPADVRFMHYRRSFSTGTARETAGVEAGLKNEAPGLRLPKCVVVHKRWIEIRLCRVWIRAARCAGAAGASLCG